MRSKTQREPISVLQAEQISHVIIAAAKEGYLAPELTKLRKTLVTQMRAINAELVAKTSDS